MISQPNRDKPEQKISVVPIPDVLVQDCESNKNENYYSSLHILSSRGLTIYLCLLTEPVSVKVSLSHDVKGIVGYDRSRVDWSWVVYDG